MHLPTRYLTALSLIALQTCVASLASTQDTFTVLSPRAQWMSAVGAKWVPSSGQVLAARDAAKNQIARDLKTLRPVGLDEYRLRDAKDILRNWNSYRLQAWGYTKHHKKLIRLSFLRPDVLRDTDWRHQLVVVSDGGSAYWQADYDPATEKILWWQANAVA